MAGSDFAGLSRRVGQAGLLRRRPGFYTARISIVGALFVAGWAAFAWLGDSWLRVLVAVYLGIIFTQVAFIGHDVGHRQVYRTRTPSVITGLIMGNLAIGLGYGWWMDKHTRHHANPNHEEHDPDVGAGVLLWSRGQAGTSSGISRYMVRFQAFFFFPLLLLEGLNLHVASVRSLFGTPMRNRRTEAALLFVHFAVYLGAIFTVLPLPKALVFIAVHQGIWGLYMGCSFAPNHKGMPMQTGTDQWDYLRRQVLTSRNVSGGWFVDVLLGGLNHQIEHHLFPSMPAPNLRKSKPLVRAYCAELGIPYAETGLIDSYRLALGHLHDVGAEVRAPDQPSEPPEPPREPVGAGIR